MQNEKIDVCTCDEGWEDEPCLYAMAIRDETEEDAMCSCCAFCREGCTESI